MATETWILNEIPQWIGISSRDFSIQFTSNNQSFTLFRFNRSGANQYDLQYNDVVVNGGTWNNSLNRPNWTGWTNQAYRTITFETPPTGDLLTWLQANGTKQQPTYKFKHWKKSNVVVNRTLVGQKYYYFKPYTILGLYTITTTLTNCTGASANATNIQENGDLTLTFTANSGYELPTGVSVTNVTSYNWNKATGVLAISKPTGDVTIEIVAVEGAVSSGYTVTITEENVAATYSVYINGVSVERDFSTNVQVFHNVKTFNIECPVTGNRIYNATGSLTNVSWNSGFAYSKDIDITEDSSASLDTDQ